MSYDIAYMWNQKKKDTNELISKQKQTHKHRKQTYGYQREGINQGFGINIYTLVYIKQITNKGVVYSTGNYTQYFVIT